MLVFFFFFLFLLRARLGSERSEAPLNVNKVHPAGERGGRVALPKTSGSAAFLLHLINATDFYERLKEVDGWRGSRRTASCPALSPPVAQTTLLRQK